MERLKTLKDERLMLMVQEISLASTSGEWDKRGTVYLDIQKKISDTFQPGMSEQSLMQLATLKVLSDLLMEIACRYEEKNIIVRNTVWRIEQTLDQLKNS